MWLEMTHNGKFGQKSGLDWVKIAIFAYFSIFFPKMRLRLTRNGQFHLIHNFSHLLPPKHLIFGEIPKIFISGRGYIGKFFEFSKFFKSFDTNVAGNDPQWQIWPKKWLRLGQNSHFCIFFYLFPQNEAEIDSEWSILPDSQLFPSFATKASHFWRNLKNFHFWGGTSANFLNFPTFSNRFTPMWLEMTHNGKFGQKSGLDWVKMAIFAYFSIFSPKMRLRLTRNGQFHLIHNFSHLLPPKHLIFGEISKIIISGGGTSANFLSFPTFSNLFTPRVGNDPQWQIWPKKWLKLGQNSHFCIFFYLFPQNEAEITQNGQFHLIHNFSHLLPPKHLIFGEFSKIFISWGGYIGKFFGFCNFFDSFHTNVAGNDPQWQIWPKTWLRLGQNSHFCIFFYLFPQNEAEIDLEWSISPDSQLFPSFATKASYFGEISKIIISGGGTSTNFLSFPNFSNHFTPMRLKMTHNGKFGQKSGLDWVKMAIFAYFSMFSLKMRLRLTRNGQFHLIHNFSHLLPPSISFLEKSQKFSFWWGGGYISKFVEFSNFFKSFDTNVTGNDPQWQIWPKKWLRLGQNSHFCIFFYLFPQNEAEIDSEWSISPDSQLFPSFATKVSHFWRNRKNFHFSGGGYISNFCEFSKFFESFHTNMAKITHNCKFC